MKSQKRDRNPISLVLSGTFDDLESSKSLLNLDIFTEKLDILSGTTNFKSE